MNKRSRVLEQRVQTMYNAARELCGKTQMAELGEIEPTFGRTTWGQALQAVSELQRATRAVRAFVRSKLTAEKRAACVHPADRRIIWNNHKGKCKDCGQPFKNAYTADGKNS